MTVPTAATTIRVYLVDDQAMIRAGFASLLSRREAFEVVGSTGEARRALEQIPHLRPDVVLLDITMPGLSGLDAIARIRRVSPRSRIVMLSHHEGPAYVEQALRAGADGYLSKDSDTAELALALEAVHRGHPYVSPRVAGGVVRGETAEAGQLASLTPREREVLQLLALGRCNKEVARDLGMSLGTAKKHRENLQRKLDCHSAAGLARIAVSEGLLPS